MPDGTEFVDPVDKAYYIYNYYRSTLLNKKYYAFRLQRYRRINVAFEYLIALGATGSGVAGWGFWTTTRGAGIWASISGASALLAIAKPLLKLTDEVEKYGKLYGEYAIAFGSVKDIVEDMQLKRAVTDEHMQRIATVRTRTAELVALEDPRPDPELIVSFQREVNSEIPVERLWVPGD